MRALESMNRPVLGIVLLMGCSGLARAQDPERIDVFKPLPSSAMIFTQLTKTSAMQGSGFLVDRADRLLLTSYHVAQAGQKVIVFFPVYDMGMVLARRDYYLKKAPRIKGTCLVSESKRDLAIIQLETVSADVPEVTLAAKSPKLGDRTHLLGNPGKSDQLWIYGIGKVKLVGEEDVKVVVKNDKEFQLQSRILIISTEDRRIGPGASGGPVVDDRGELIGVIQSLAAADASQIRCVQVAEIRSFLGDYHRNLATQALAGKKYPEAIARATRALQVNPDDALAFNERGTAHMYQTRYDEAIADYTAALKLDPNLPRTWRSRASSYYFKTNFNQAVADCTQAIKLDPNYAQAYLSRSKAHAKLGNKVESQLDHDMAIRLDPSLR